MGFASRIPLENPTLQRFSVSLKKPDDDLHLKLFLGTLFRERDGGRWEEMVADVSEVVTFVPA